MFHSPSTEDVASLLFPQWLEYTALHSPSHVIFAHETFLDSGVMKIVDWKTLYCAFSKAAQYITSHLGSFEEPPVVAVLGNLDTITYYALLGGIWLSGATPFLLSTRNSAAAVAHLLDRTNVSVLLVGCDDQMQALAAAALRNIAGPYGGNSPIKLFPTPKHEDLFNALPIEFRPPHIPKSVGFDSAALILHSSGSTAFPKPITITHKVLRQWASQSLEPDANEAAKRTRLAVHSAPVFHTMGVASWIGTLGSGQSLGVYPPSEPPIVPSPDNFLASAIATQCDGMIAVPRFLEMWVSQSKDIELLKTFKAVTFGGGPLGRDVGQTLVDQGVKLVNYYGTTEIGLATPFFYAPYTEWEWITLRRGTHVHFRPIEGEISQFELVFLMGPSHTPSVLNTEVDGVKGFGTNDIIVRHPTDPWKVKILGRADDQIMLSTGEKTNPGPMEAIIAKNPLVSAALMFGRGREQNGVIVQPVTPILPSDAVTRAGFISAIWPSVEEANAFAPGHSRIFKELIIVTSPDRPFRFTPKQSIIRKSSLADYDADIEAIYKAVEEDVHHDIDGPEQWTFEGVHAFIRRVTAKIMERDLGDEDDIFVHGGDSLRATWMRNAFVHALRQSPHSTRTSEVGQGFIYSNPTIAQLTTAIYALTADDSSSTSAAAALQKRVDAIESLVAEFTSDFPTHVANPSRFNGPTNGDVVLITGTTGGLGAQLVSTFAAIPSVKKIYAVNRSSRQSLKDRQREALLERGLDASILDGDKVVLVEGNTEKVGFDISQELYEEMRDNVTLMIHNAWRVNFVLQVASFKPLLQGTRNLVDFSLSSPRAEPPRILYTGSISEFIGWDLPEAPAERAIEARYAVGNGYSESKYIGERILQAASEVTPLRPVSIRVGQMTGTNSGAWNSTDWVPGIARAGQVLGALPDRGDSVAWFSLELAARAIHDFRNSPSVHLNLEHPAPFSWSAVFREFSRHLNVPLVPWGQWLEKLEEVNAADPENKLRNPAALLIPFYRSGKDEADPKSAAPGNLPFMALEKALACSESLRRAAVEPVDIESDVEKWVAHWRTAGLLD